MPNGLPAVPEIKIEGALIPVDVEMVEVRVEQVVAGASRVVMRFSDDDFKVLDGGMFELAKAVKVSIGDENGTGVDVFTGEITSVAIEQGRNDRHELVVEAMDKSHRLARDTTPKTYLEMSYSDIINQIVGEHGINAQVSGDALSSKLPYVMRSGTAFEFFDDIALRTGSHWYFDRAGTLQFKENAALSGPDASVEWGVSLLRFRARFSDNGHAKKITVKSWDYTSKQAINQSDEGELRSPTGVSDPAIISAMRSKYGSAQGEMLVATAGAATAAEATNIAKGIGRRQSLNEFTARGEVYVNPVFFAGMTLEVKGVGTKMSGNYYVTNVEHLFSANNSITRFSVGGLQNSTIVDLIGGRSSTALTPWKQGQLVTGVVTNNKDEDNLGRIKVKFPMFSDDDESYWARVAHPGAGNARGMYFVPNIDDEVLVGFEHGDLRRPVVLGGLWNGNDKPWVDSTKNIDGSSKSIQWGIQTRTGHQLVFNEDAGDDKNSFKLTMKDGSIFYVGHDKVELIHKTGKPIEVKTGQADMVFKEDKITITANEITLDAKQKLTLKSGTDLEVKAGTNLKMSAAVQGELKADAGLKVNTSAILELKGSMTKIN